MNHLNINESNSGTAELEKVYEVKGLEPKSKELPISSKVLRVPADRLVLIGSGNKPKDYADAFADAVHWYRQILNDGKPFTFRFFPGEHSIAVREMLWTLRSSLSRDVPMEVWEGNGPAVLTAPNFETNSKRRMGQLLKRKSYHLPELASEICSQVGSPIFRWYRNVTASFYSGRLDGLEVCRLQHNGLSGTISIGKTGKDGAISGERRKFLTVSQGRECVPFNVDTVAAAAEMLRQLATDREGGVLACGQGEHCLEARLLNGKTRITLQDSLELECVTAADGLPFQFPTQWSSDGSDRYVDVLMRSGDVPWVVEIKDPKTGMGQHLRHAVVQAVLYREYIRNADRLHPWFEEQGLSAKACRAAVTFPKLPKSAARWKLHVEDLAKLFDVAVVELPPLQQGESTKPVT